MPKERILVVEDEILVAEELREDLERLGYTVAGVVGSGEEVVEAVAKYKPDLLLMDVRLEGAVDGIEAAFQARAEFGIPVIYLSAYSDAETLGRAALTSPSAYLLKPFNERELAANISMALSSARSRSSSLERLRGNEPLVDALGLPALLLDPSGLIVYANEAALSLLKVRDFALVRGESLSRFVDLGAGNDAEQSRLLVAADGSTSNAVVRIEPLALADGGEIGAIVVFDRMSGRERGLLESSASAMNEAILSNLPGPTAGGKGYEIGGFLLPCPSGSGDLFDVFPVGLGRFCFFGLDVMGHGPLASLIAWSLRDLIRAAAAEEEVREGGPASILNRVNARYRERSFGPESVFFSVALGLVDRATGHYILGRAGHPPLLLLKPAKPAELIHGGGVAIGLAPELDIEEISGILEPGSRLVLFSDGLLEAYAEGKKGLEEAALSVERSRELLLAEFINGIRARTVEGFSGDDASLLVIERSGLAQ